MPVQALNHEGNKTTVFVVNPDGELEDRPVQVGLQTASDAEIVSGLNEGEQVVVSDRSGLKPGQKVHPQAMAVMQYQEQNAAVVSVIWITLCQDFQFAIRTSSS